MAQPTHEVHLAIYDLSGGMARALSAQFLGAEHVIDIIPHTAIVAYGREYYFGNGIQSDRPSEFRQSRQIFPIDVQSLGRTTLTQSEFEAWCRTVTSSGLYSPTSYDLLNRNCNNFSHDAAIQGLRLPRGVPDWILEVPRRFLSSPMGQMVRPMLEGMQVTGGGNAAPFSDTSGRPNQFASSSTRPAVEAAPAPPAAAINPWAGIPSSSSSRPPAATADAPAKVEIKTPVLDSHNRPLLSNDAATVKVCVAKLTKTTLSETQRLALDQLSEQLAKGTKPTGDVLERSSQAMLPYLREDGSGRVASDLVFALMLLRLVVLHPSNASSGDSPATAVAECLETVARNLLDEAPVSPYHKSPAARSMAWCTLSNACGSADDGSKLDHFGSISLELLVDGALMDMSAENQPRAEVRQSASAFLYNVAHVMTPPSSSGVSAEGDGTLSDILVSLLCGSTDGLSEESDSTTKLRRLLVAAKVMVSSEAAKNLAKDLGFVDAIDNLAGDKGVAKEGNEAKFRDLVTEMQGLLST